MATKPAAKATLAEQLDQYFISEGGIFQMCHPLPETWVRQNFFTDPEFPAPVNGTGQGVKSVRSRPAVEAFLAGKVGVR